MHPSIRVENVTKCFRLGGRVRGGLNLTERIASYFRERAKTTDFWALNGVSFEVDHGEAVGIIGRNGRGQKYALESAVAHHRTDSWKGRIARAAWEVCSKSGPAFTRS